MGKKTAFLLGLLLASTATSQDFPSRPVRLLTPYGAGGSYDGLSRVMADKLSRQFGHQVIVDNRPGAAGRIGMAIGTKLPPDGYNIMMIGNTQTIAPSVHGKVPYDLDKDFDGLAMVAIITNVLVIHPNVPAKSVQEFVSLLKAKPGALRFGSGGTGGITHLAGELFKSMTGTNMIHVPYKSGALAMNAVVGGEVEMNVLNMLNSAPHVRSGRLRGLGVTGAKRSHFLPELPTLDESGVKGYEIVEFYAFVVPAKTPRALVKRLHSEIATAVNSSELKERFTNLSSEPLVLPPEETKAYILRERVKYAKIVKEVGIVAD
jgi:tripartite-type tricarboxylate transporter receptor subunit TctC